MILEKKVKFNNNDWFVTVDDNYFEVFLYNENGEINPENVYRGCVGGKTLIDKCRNIILQANESLFSIDEIDDFQKWDGDMDKELNIR